MSLFTFVELNCENLFDTRHDSLKQDTEFLPTAVRRWTPYRYWHKLNRIGQAIVSCGVLDTLSVMPDMVALTEVENDSVLTDLTRRSLLRQAGYEYVMTASPDERGIDVALMWSPFAFRLIRHHAIRIDPPKGFRHTRDILYASGEVITGDTLHVFVVHAVNEPHALIASWWPTDWLMRSTRCGSSAHKPASLWQATSTTIRATQPCRRCLHTGSSKCRKMLLGAMEPKALTDGMAVGTASTTCSVVRDWPHACSNVASTMPPSSWRKIANMVA